MYAYTVVLLHLNNTNRPPSWLVSPSLLGVRMLAPLQRLIFTVYIISHLVLVLGGCRDPNPTVRSVCVLYVVHNRWNSPFTFSAFVIMVIVCWTQAPCSVNGTSLDIISHIHYVHTQSRNNSAMHPLVAPSYLDLIYFCQESGGLTI